MFFSKKKKGGQPIYFKNRLNTIMEYWYGDIQMPDIG